LESVLSLVDIIEYESRAPFWMQSKPGNRAHAVDATVIESISALHQMLVRRGLENRIEVMADGGLNASNVGPYVRAGMTAGEFSSPLLQGPIGKFRAGTGQIAAAARHLRRTLDDALAGHPSA
jgi:pentose-5-phosphate-3-epimerase